MPNLDVVYLYEHASRELDVACSVSALLEWKYRLNIEIIHWPVGFSEAVTRFKPHLVILPFCYHDSSYRSLLAYWRESIFLNLTWEQMFYPGNKNAKTPQGDFPLKHVLHHAWSDEYAQLLRNIGIPNGNIFVNGQPAYKLYDEPYRKYFLSRADLADRHGLDPSSRWVFFPENYNWAFYTKATIRRFIEKGQLPEDVLIMQEYCRDSLAEMLLWCDEAARLEDVEIILRPRPSTNRNEFIRFASKVLKNIPSRLRIIQQGSVREWIMASDTVISSHSTSLIEAAVAGKPAHIVSPYPIPPQLHVEWHDLLPNLRTRRDFLQVVLSDGQHDRRLGDWARKTLMAHGDSIHNIASHVAGLLQEDAVTPEPLSQQVVASWFRWIPPAGSWALYRKIRNFLRFPSSFGVETEYIKDHVSRKEIRTRIEKWKDLLVESGD